MAGGLLSSIEQRTGEVRTPSQSFVHALAGSHLGGWCMNSYRVRKTVGMVWRRAHIGYVS